jgi:hypothetical protein
MVDRVVVNRGEIPSPARLAEWTGAAMVPSDDLPMMHLRRCEGGDETRCG